MALNFFFPEVLTTAVSLAEGFTIAVSILKEV